MMELILGIFILYVGIRIAWWLIKTTLFLGIAFLAIAAFFTPWWVVF